jgi:hypothetical protein
MYIINREVKRNYRVDTSICYVHSINMINRGRPSKPRSERRIVPLHIMLTEAERKLFEKAAKRDSSDISGWARRILLKAATED